MVCNYSDAIAIKYGINAALITSFIKSRLDEINFCSNGVPWVRITVKELTGTFPFLGEKAVRNAIKRLIKGNILVSKQLGKEHFDHAHHYSITAHGYAVIRGDEKDDRNKWYTNHGNLGKVHLQTE